MRRFGLSRESQIVDQGLPKASVAIAPLLRRVSSTAQLLEGECLLFGDTLPGTALLYICGRCCTYKRVAARRFENAVAQQRGKIEQFACQRSAGSRNYLQAKQ
jgi:hypothetical protein